MHLHSLFHNIRFYVLAFSVLYSIAVYVIIISLFPDERMQIIRSTQIYSLTSLVFLYLALLTGPFCYTFKGFPFRGHYLKARRAIGVSAFYFGLLHACFAFFGQLGGFDGLGFLSNKYLIAISLSFTALVILFLMAATSFDFMISKLTFPKWKLLHRFVYLAGIFVLIHALMLGTHYSKLSTFIPLVTFIALSFLLLLEAPRFDKYITKVMQIPQFGISFVLAAVMLSGIIFIYIKPLTNGASPFGVHAEQPTQQERQQRLYPFEHGGSQDNIPEIEGDRNKRYTVSMSTDPEDPQPNQDVTIRFKIYDASSGNRVMSFRTLYEKPMDFITVNSDLTYFNHVYPTKQDHDFVITTQFPSDDVYHLFIDFKPSEGIQQQFTFTLPVGQIPSAPSVSKAQPDTDKTKTFGDYAVSFGNTPRGRLNAAGLSDGQQIINFTVKPAKRGKPAIDLKPYRASLGQLTMVNEKTYDFIHAHQFSLTIENNVPTVNFVPFAIYGKFEPGIYRAFAEFNPNIKPFIADFTVRVK